MNTIIFYLYRDASNYKKIQKVILEGAMSEDQIEQVMNSLDDGLYFIPEQVGLLCNRFEEYGRNEDDHCWCELEKEGIERTEKSATIDMTATQLVKAFQNAAGNWDDVKYAV